MYRIQRKKKHESKKNSWEVEIGIPQGGGTILLGPNIHKMWFFELKKKTTRDRLEKTIVFFSRSCDFSPLH
jgi:hypothetical protein